MSQGSKTKLDQEICTKPAVHLKLIEIAALVWNGRRKREGKSLSNTLSILEVCGFVLVTGHRAKYDRLNTAKVFERAQDGCRSVKLTKSLPSDTFWFHLNVIVLGENVGGAVRVFLNRLWAQWWRDRAQTTWHNIQTHIETHTGLGHQQRNMIGKTDQTWKTWNYDFFLLPGILCICLNIVLYQSLDFSVFWNCKILNEQVRMTDKYINIMFSSRSSSSSPGDVQV